MSRIWWTETVTGLLFLIFHLMSFKTTWHPLLFIFLILPLPGPTSVADTGRVVLCV